MAPALRLFASALGTAIVLTAAATMRDGWRPRPSDSWPRLTVISVASLSWDRVTPLLRAGLLPNLDALTAHGGVAGDILATDFPTRTSILASLLTGRSPQRHRIAESADLAGSDPDEDRTPVWRYLAEAGQPCAVAGFPLVFPGEHPDNRVMPRVSAPGIPVPPELIARVTGGQSLSAELGAVLADSLSGDLGSIEAARAAVVNGGRRHLFLHLSGLGRWEEALRQRLPETGRASLAEDYYRVLDGMLGDVLAWRGRDGAVFLISEAGNLSGRPSQRRDFPVVEHYPSFGFLWATGQRILGSALPTTMLPPDLTPTLLYLVGLPLPRTEGRVAFALLQENYHFKHPLTFR